MDWFHLQLLHWLYGSYKTYRGAAIKITLYNKTPSWTINITSRTYLKENWSFPLHTKGIIFRIHKFLVKTPPPPRCVRLRRVHSRSRSVPRDELVPFQWSRVRAGPVGFAPFLRSRNIGYLKKYLHQAWRRFIAVKGPRIFL